MKILRIKVQNYLSFLDEEIKFDRTPTMYLVTGRNDETVDDSDCNGCGKSSFLSSVRFCIWGKIRGEFSKDLNLEDVIHKNQKDEIAGTCLVEIDFELNDIFYRVVRSVAQSGQTLDFYSSVDNLEWICLSLKAGISRRTGKRESGITRTQDRINTVLGMDDSLFSNSAYFEQSNIDVFSRGSLAEKDNVFKTAIGLSKWEDYAALMKDDMSKISSDEKAKLNILEDIGDQQELESALEFANGELRNKIKDRKELEQDLNKTKNEIDKLSKTISKLDVTYTTNRAKYKEYEEKLHSLIPKLRNEENELDDLNHSISQTSKSITSKKVQHLNIKDTGIQLKDKLENINRPKESEDSCREKYDQHKKKIVELSVEIRSLEARVEDIKDAVCPLGLVCKSITEDGKQKLIDNVFSGIEKLNEEKESTHEKVMLAHRKLVEWDEYKTLVQKLNAARSEYKALTVEVKSLIDSRKKDKLRVEKSKNIICELKEEIAKIRETLSDSDKLDEIKRSIQGKNIRLGELENIYSAMLRKRDAESDDENTCKVNIGLMQEKIDKINKIKTDLLSIQDRKRTVKEALFVVGKDIPHILISQAVPEIQHHVRNFVYDLSGGRIDIEFRMVKELKNKTSGSSNEVNAFDPWVCVDGRWLKYEQTSGGERTRVDVAIHLGWVCFKASRSNVKIDTLFLDEVGSALDRAGMERLVELLRNIMDEYYINKVFFATQNQDAKKLFDNKIQITKTSEGSKVVFV